MILRVPDGQASRDFLDHVERRHAEATALVAKIHGLTKPPTFAGRVDPTSEDGLSMQVAAALHEWIVTGRMAATYTKIPHEVGAVARGSREFGRANARYAKQRAMGMVTGSADFVLVWHGGGGWIELKKKGGALSPAQADFREWCNHFGARYAICRSVGDVEATIIGWGVMS